MARTSAILTTSGNATVAQLHECMPVILEPDASPAWLGEEDRVPTRGVATAMLSRVSCSVRLPVQAC